MTEAQRPTTPSSTPRVPPPPPAVAIDGKPSSVWSSPTYLVSNDADGPRHARCRPARRSRPSPRSATQHANRTQQACPWTAHDGAVGARSV